MGTAVGYQADNNPARRVLVLAPTGRDATLIAEALGAIGVTTFTCPDADGVCEQIAAGAAAAVIAEEALNAASVKTFAEAIASQPTWSDFPLIVMTNGGASTPVVEYKLNALAPLGNVILVERPLRPPTLLSVIRTAQRARERQYQVRDLLSEIRIAEERLRAMIESAQDYAIISLDGTGCITYWNSGAERVLGYSEHEAIGKRVEMIFTQGDRMAGVPEIELRTAGISGRSETEGWRVRKDGSTFWGSGVVTPIQHSGLNTGPSGFLKVLRDMTVQRQTADRLALQATLLARSNEDLQRFAYVASHDLQEPLRMVGSYSQLLVHRNREKLDDDSLQFVDYILTGVTQMRTLINDLLEFSRLTGDEPPATTAVDCNAVLGLALQNLHMKINESGAAVIFSQLPIVRAHESRLLQVFQNLIGNALKYNSGKPVVNIDARPDGEFWVISVRDNGIGIAPEYHERIFGLFRRLHTRDEYAGTGIGLATCKRIIEQAGGRIWVESTPGQGSTFHFTLPSA